MKKPIFISVLLILAAVLLFVSQQNYKEKIERAASQTASAVPAVTKAEPAIEIDPNKVSVYAFNGTVDIYVKGSTKDSDKYIGYHLRRTAQGKNKEVFASNYDIWNIAGANEYQLKKSGIFSISKKVVAPGEWEMALSEVGSNDFVGGTLHGDEFLTNVQFLVNNEEVDLADSIETIADTVTLKTVSDLFRDSSMTEENEKIAEHIKTYTITKDGLVIDQEIIFTTNLKLQKSYLAMLPMLRKSEGASGEQVTDTVQIAGESVTYNVSEERFNLAELKNVKSNEVKLWGQDSGLSAVVTVLSKSPELPTVFHLSDSPGYNKMYFGFNPNGHQVKANDVWKQSTQYKIDTIN